MAAYKRFAPTAVEERFNRSFVARQLWEEPGFQHSDTENYGIEHYLFDRIKYQEWQIFCLQPTQANATIVREFYAHGPSKDSLYVHCRGKPVRLDADTINLFYGLTPDRDDHSAFMEDITNEDYELIKDDLCYANTNWETSSHRGSVARQNLKPEAKLWNTFVKRQLIPTSHNNTVDKRRLVLIQSIINKRNINVGELII